MFPPAVEQRTLRLNITWFEQGAKPNFTHLKKAIIPLFISNYAYTLRSSLDARLPAASYSRRACYELRLRQIKYYASAPLLQRRNDHEKQDGSPKHFSPDFKW